MSNSFEAGASSPVPAGEGTVHVQASPGQVGITLLDGYFRPVAEGLGRLKKRVPAGLYELRYDTGLGRKRELFSLEPGPDDVPPRLVQVEFSAAAPIPG